MKKVLQNQKKQMLIYLRLKKLNFKNITKIDKGLRLFHKWFKQYNKY